MTERKELSIISRLSELRSLQWPDNHWQAWNGANRVLDLGSAPANSVVNGEIIESRFMVSIFFCPEE